MMFSGLLRDVSAHSEFIDVPVPLEEVWGVITDLQATPDILDKVLSFEYVDDDIPSIQRKREIAVGTQFRITSECSGKRKVESYQTVTRLEAQNQTERFVSTGTSYQGDFTPDMVNTSTLTIQQIDKSNTRLICSIAVDFHLGLKALFFKLFCRSCFARAVRAHLRNELDCYSRESIRRFKLVGFADQEESMTALTQSPQ